VRDMVFIVMVLVAVISKVFFFFLCECPSQFVCILINSTDPEINNHVDFQWF